MTIQKKIRVGALALAISTVMSSNAGAASSHSFTTFKDLGDASPWARSLIQEAQDKQLMTGDPEGLFRPLQTVTRQEVAAALAKAFNLSVDANSGSSFSDVSKDLWSAGVINAVKREGWMKGDSNGAFRPKDNITREEMAAILARAAGLDKSNEIETVISSFKDSGNISSWAKESVATVVSSGLMIGSNERFSPQKTILRQELATILVRINSDNGDLQNIQRIENGIVTIGEASYTIADSLKPLFKDSNIPVLTNAGVRFVADNGQITQILSLDIVTSGSAAGEGQAEFSKNLIFDGGKASIDGNLKIAADFITIKNLNINGNLEIGEELEHDFYAQQVTVKGSTFVRGGDENTVVFDQSSLKGMEVSKDGVRVEATNKTVVQEVNINSRESGLWGDESITYQTVKVEESAFYVYLAAHINNLELNAGSGETIVSGNGVLDNVTVKGSGEISILNKGAIGKLTITDIETKITLPSNVPIQSIVLPPGVSPEQVIKNYDTVKSQIAKINDLDNPDYNTNAGQKESPSTGGGNGSGSSNGGGSPSNPESPPPTTNPTNRNPLLYYSYQNRNASSADVLVTSEKTGTFYYLAIPSDIDFLLPNKDQIKSGSLPGYDSVLSGEFTVSANQKTVYKLDGMQEDKRYRIWGFFKESGTGVESNVVHLTYILNYHPNSIYVLPYPIANLSQIRIQFTGKLESQITNTLDPAAIIKSGRLRNYGFGHIPITSINWDLSIPDMPILNLNFDTVTLGDGKSFYIDWSYTENGLYIMDTHPDGTIYKKTFGGHGSYGGEDIVALITKQLSIEAGNIEDPTKADDVLHVLKVYPHPLEIELGVIDFNAKAYQKALSESDNYLTYADVQKIIAAVNEKYPAPSTYEADAIRSMNHTNDALIMQGLLRSYASVLTIDKAEYEELHELIRIEIAQSMINQRALDPFKKYSSIEEINIAYEQAYQTVSMVPTSIRFVDSDNQPGIIGGEIIWTPGKVDDVVDHYEILWGTDGQPTSTIANIDKQAGNVYILQHGTMIPAGANQLFVRAILKNGTSTLAISMALEDTLPPTPSGPNVRKDEIRNLLIGADDSMEFSVDGGNTWSPYDERNPPTFPGDVSVGIRVKADPVNQVPAGFITTVSFVDVVNLYIAHNDVRNTFESIYATSALEYSVDNGATWTTFDEQNPPEFPGDMNVLLRERGGQYLPPGPAKSFLFTSKVHMQFPGSDYLWTTSSVAEYSLNGGSWIPLPFDQQVKFQPGDVVDVREAARGVFPAGAKETYTF
jgi:hypothetical protein